MRLSCTGAAADSSGPQGRPAAPVGHSCPGEAQRPAGPGARVRGPGARAGAQGQARRRAKGPPPPQGGPKSPGGRPKPQPEESPPTGPAKGPGGGRVAPAGATTPGGSRSRATRRPPAARWRPSGPTAEAPKGRGARSPKDTGQPGPKGADRGAGVPRPLRRRLDGAGATGDGTGRPEGESPEGPEPGPLRPQVAGVWGQSPHSERSEQGPAKPGRGTPEGRFLST